MRIDEVSTILQIAHPGNNRVLLKYMSEASTKEATRYQLVRSRNSAHENITVRRGIAQASTVVRLQRN